MKQTMSRLNLFYIVAFLPLVLIAYLNIGWLFSVVVPLYGFILLLIKKDDLSLRGGTRGFQRVLGMLIAVGSFLVYYALDLFFESPSFYGGVNYAVYILGIFLMFFEFSALRAAFTPIFLLLAASSTSIVSQWLKHYFSWYIPHFMWLVVAILNLLGVGAELRSPVAIMIPTVKGHLVLGFVWECIGVSSMLTFLIVLVVTLFEESASLRTKLLWAAGGVFGTFMVNVIRVVVIFLVDCFYGSDVGGKVHYFIGYVFFILWLLAFFYIFSKRQALAEKILPIWQKLRSFARGQKVEARRNPVSSENLDTVRPDAP